MCIGNIPQCINLENGEQIKHCEEYKYLELNITQNGILDQAVKERNIQGRTSSIILVLIQ